MDALWIVFLAVTEVAPYVFPVAVLGLVGALVYSAARRAAPPPAGGGDAGGIDAGDPARRQRPRPAPPDAPSPAPRASASGPGGPSSDGGGS